jgi:hypothetical protein
LEFYNNWVHLLLVAGLGALGTQSSFSQDIDASRVNPPRISPLPSESDQDGETLGVDSTHESFQVNVPGGSVTALCLIGRTKKQLLGSFSTSAPKIIAPDGKRYDLWDQIPEDLSTCELEIVLIDLMQENSMRPIIINSLESEPKLKGLPWGTAKRDSPSVNVELRMHDPSSPGGYRFLKSATIRSSPGKSQHLLRFKLDRGCLEALATNRDALFVTVSMSVLCRISVAQVIAEWQALSNESLNALNDLKSASNGNAVMFVNTGGDLRADQGLRQYLQSRLQAAVWVKRGSNVPPEMVSSLLESVFTSSKIASQAQVTKADELISVVIANQVVVSGIKSNISELIDDTRLAIEKGELDATHTSREFAAGGSVSVMGVGAGLNASSGQSDEIQRERLTKELADASKIFKGSITGFSAIDLQQISNVMQDAISTGDSQFGTFHTRNENFEIDVSIDPATQNDKLLQSELDRQSHLLQELRTLSSTAKAETELIENSLKEAGSIEEMETLLSQSLYFQRLVAHLEGFWAWGKHNAALGDGRCLDRVPEWLNGVENGKIRQAECDSRQSQLSTLTKQLSSRIDKLAKVKIHERLAHHNKVQSGRMVEIGKELETLNDKIKTLRALGAKE